MTSLPLVVPPHLQDHEKWLLHQIHFDGVHLVVELVSEKRELSDPRQLVKLCFKSPVSFGFVDLCYMNEYLDEPQPVIRRIDVGKFDFNRKEVASFVPGFRIGEPFASKDWQRYEVAAGDEVIHVLTAKPPTIEQTEVRVAYTS